MEPVPYPGLLIAFEGIDGAGKTTQVKLLADLLAAAGEAVVLSKEPTDGPWGRRIRASAATKRMTATEELHAFTEDRKEHIADLIRPALKAGKTVVLDRYFYSTIAYQSVAGADPDSVTAAMLDFCPVPDAVVLIDVPADVGWSRIQDGRNETPNQFESLSNLTAVRSAFHRIAARRPEVIVIDGTRTVGECRFEIANALVDGVLKPARCAKVYGCESPEYCGPRMSGTCRWANIKHLVRN